jgi:hypothetical protein
MKPFVEPAERLADGALTPAPPLASMRPRPECGMTE